MAHKGVLWPVHQDLRYWADDNSYPWPQYPSKEYTIAWNGSGSGYTNYDCGSGPFTMEIYDISPDRYDITWGTVTDDGDVEMGMIWHLHANGVNRTCWQWMTVAGVQQYPPFNPLFIVGNCFIAGGQLTGPDYLGPIVGHSNALKTDWDYAPVPW